MDFDYKFLVTIWTIRRNSKENPFGAVCAGSNLRLPKIVTFRSFDFARCGGFPRFLVTLITGRIIADTKIIKRALVSAYCMVEPC